MSDTLPRLLQEIHSTSTPNELQLNFENFQSRISAILYSNPLEYSYYSNHTGRELYRKLYNFGLNNLITTPYDSGFRPDPKSSLWLPSEASAKAWYDASDSSTIIKNASNEVTAWADKSSNSNNLTAKDNPVTGSSTLNSLNVFDVDGGDYFELNNLSTPASGNLQAFIVCNVTAVNNNTDAILSMDSQQRDWQIQANTADFFRGNLVFAGQSSPSTGGGSANLTGYHIYCADLDFTDDGQYQLLMDGALLPGTNQRTYTGKLASNVNFRIFANRGENEFPQGSVAEVILLDNTDNSTRQKVEGYLAHKWGLTSSLPSNHPYKVVIPQA